MADESKPDAHAWGEQDWAADSGRPEKPRSRRWIGFAIAGVVGLVLLSVAGLWMQAQHVAQIQAEMDHRRGLDEQLRLERAESERIKAAELTAKTQPDIPLVLPRDEALRLIGDAETLNNNGLFLLDKMDNPEEAIENFRAAAKLDPKYEANVERARKRQIQLDHTAPRPREVEGS